MQDEGYHFQLPSQAKFSVPEWPKVAATLPVLKMESEMDRLRRAAGEEYLKSLLKSVGKSKEERVACPAGLAIRLSDLYNNAFGIAKRKREEPYVVVFSDNCMKTQKPEKLGEPSPKCPLAIVDFSRQKQREWTQAEVYSLIEYVMDMSALDTVVIVFFVKPGNLSVNVQLALANFSNDRKGKIHSEFGRYSPPNESSIEGHRWKGVGDMVLFAGVTFDPDIIWSDIFLSRQRASWYYNDDDDNDFDLKEAEAFEDENEEEKVIEDLLRDRAPNWRCLGPTKSTGEQWVNPDAKPRRVLKDILIGSRRRETQ
jgi:hypothetical protein